MKEKYIDEEFGIFYDDAGSLFYSFNTREEKEIDVSSLSKESIEIIVNQHNRLLEAYKKLIFDKERQFSEDGYPLNVGM